MQMSESTCTNPQDAAVEQPKSIQKRYRPSVISYAAAVKSPSETNTVGRATSTTTTTSQTTAQQVTTVSSLTDHDLDQLYERLKQHVTVEVDDSPGISTEDMERIVQDSNNIIQQVRNEMRTSVANLTAEVTKIGDQVKRQNAVVVGVQKTLEATTKDIKDSVNQQVAELTNQIQSLRTLVISLMPSPTLQAETQ